MKTKFLTLVTFLIISYGYSQKKYNVFENPSPLIQRLEFNSKGMNLKLSKKGISYVQKDLNNNSHIIARIVKKLHNKMVGGSSKLKLDCIATQVYWHCLFYDLKKPSNSREDNYGVLRHLKISKQLRKLKGYKPPKSLIKTQFNFLSNQRMKSMEVEYVELFVNGCKQGGKYVVPPNIVSLISKWIDRYKR